MLSLTDEAHESLKTMGKNIETARLRRRVSVKLLCERSFITAQTYRRLRDGDPGVSLGVVMSVLQVMGLDFQIAAVADPRLDEVGLGLDATWRQKRFKGEPDKLDTNF